MRPVRLMEMKRVEMKTLREKYCGEEHEDNSALWLLVSILGFVMACFWSLQGANL